MSKPKVVYQTVAERHHWVLRFDSITNIDSFQVQRISPLAYDAKAKKWKSVSIEFIEILENSMFMKLVDVAKNVEKQKPIVLEFLDGPGKGYHKLVFADYEICEVNHDDLDYGNGDIVNSRMIISPIRVEFLGHDEEKFGSS